MALHPCPRMPLSYYLHYENLKPYTPWDKFCELLLRSCVHFICDFYCLNNFKQFPAFSFNHLILVIFMTCSSQHMSSSFTFCVPFKPF
jgi:hypothetical protein